MAYLYDDTTAFPTGDMPAAPAAGATVTDPATGTVIMRVTSASTSSGAEFATAYSYWQSFNCDSTRLLIEDVTNGIMTHFVFNPVAFTLGSKTTPTFSTGGTGSVTREGMMWNHTNPDVLYFVQGVQIRSYNFGTATSTTIASLGSEFSIANSQFWQPSISSDDDVIAFSVKDTSSGDYTGYGAYKISTNTVLYHVDTAILDEVQLDKSGRYLIVKTGVAPTVGANRNKIVDLNTSTVTDLLNQSPNFAFGHSDVGSGIAVGADNLTDDWRKFNLVTNTTPPILFAANYRFYDAHVSLPLGTEAWVHFSPYGDSSPVHFSAGVLDRELMFVKMDASGDVVRYARHWSTGTAYNMSVRANRSMDGKFVVFNSNWGVEAGRVDVWIAQVPAEVIADAPAPPRVNRIHHKLKFS
jgi:hypothetical protein